jgi:urocanate hydratase
MLSPTDLQRQTLRLYGELLSQNETWGGKLIFTSGPGASATGLPAAVSIAGGTTLALDPDSPTVKAVFRQGGIDFVVNTLDEALRVLKNEIRQHKPLSVALISPIQPVLDEIASRGLAPDLEYSVSPNLEVTSNNTSLTSWLAARNWSEVILPAASTSDLRALDLRLFDILPPDDTLRRRWLQRIPHYQRPSTTPARVVWLTPAEQAAL